MDAENEIEMFDGPDTDDVDSEVTFQPGENQGDGGFTDLPGLSNEMYIANISNENITPEQRKAALTRPIQRIYTSIAGADFSVAHDATPRMQMFCSHSTQRLVFEGMTPKNIINGTEQEFGKANFRIDVKEDCIVKHVIHQYSRNLSADSINDPQRTYVIVQNTGRDSPGYFDVIVIENYFSMHQHFGFWYKDGKDLHKISPGARLFKGDVLKETPSTTENGDYMFGRELKTVMMTHRSVAEDGIAICEDVLEKFAFWMFEERRVSWGKKSFPLNTYGSDLIYKIMPDIGEYLRPDDVLMSTRENDDEVAIAMQNQKSVREIDHVFDESVYVVGGGEVISIDVTCNNEAEHRMSDVEQQLRKYHTQTTDMYKKLIAIDKKLRSDYGASYFPSPALNNLICEAYIGTNFNGTSKVSKLYRRAVMDDFTVRFIVKKKMIPTYGFKFTDTRGRKGVCCAILPRSQMPVDKNGVSADIIVDPVACINRMIMGGPIEAGLNVITDIVTRSIRDALGINLDLPSLKRDIKIMADGHDPRIENAWQNALDYYKEVAPVSMYPKALTATQKDKATVLTYAAKRPLGLYLPPETTPNMAVTLNRLHQIYKPDYQSVTYRDRQGNLVRSKDDMAISDVYMMLLEKIGDDRSASSSVRFQVFGVPASASKHDRFTSATRWQNGKIHGESEARIFNAITRPSIQPEIMDRNNNPKTAEICYRNHLQAENPSQIEKLIDRSKYPFNMTMPIQNLDHFTVISGYRFVYRDDNPGAFKYSDMVRENSAENIYA